MFISNYAWAKSIDDASGIYSFSQPSGLNLGQFPQQFLNINKGPSEFDRKNDFTAAIQYVTSGNKWVRNFQIFPMLTAHTGLPLYIGQTNENAAQNASNQQRPNYNGGSLITSEVPNGTGVQYLVPVSSASFPLSPTGPYYSGTGTARTQQFVHLDRHPGPRRRKSARPIGSERFSRPGVPANGAPEVHSSHGSL